MTTTQQQSIVSVERLPGNPILYPDPHIDALVGSNINGPSLIRVPAWVERPLGRYYLYFAHHSGDNIRLAYADALEGPWMVYRPGTLQLEQSHFVDHIASPDVHVDDERREIRMYYHGLISGDQSSHAHGRGVRSVQRGDEQPYVQGSRVAISKDGLSFTALPEMLGAPYMRVFRWGEWHYALGMPGIFSRSRDGLTAFERGPQLFTPAMRHTALMLDGDTLRVFYSNAGDCPERILLATIALTPDWNDWTASEPATVLEPETGYEGIAEPLTPSARGLIMGPVRQLRDPAIFREHGRTYLLYSIAGEHGIAIAEIKIGLA